MESGAPPDRLSFPTTEESILEYWNSIDAFQRSLKMNADKPEYIFYDGPPVCSIHLFFDSHSFFLFSFFSNCLFYILIYFILFYILYFIFYILYFIFYILYFIFYILYFIFY